MPAGRPKKYLEKRVMISLFLPEVIVDYLSQLAAEQGVSRTEIIQSILVSAEKGEAERLIAAYKEMKESIRLMTETTKIQNETLKQLKRKTMMQLYIDFHEDERVKELERLVKEHYLEYKKLVLDGLKRGLRAESIADSYAEKLFRIHEATLFKDGILIKNEKTIKKIIKNLLMNLQSSR